VHLFQFNVSVGPAPAQDSGRDRPSVGNLVQSWLRTPAMVAEDHSLFLAKGNTGGSDVAEVCAIVEEASDAEAVRESLLRFLGERCPGSEARADLIEVSAGQFADLVGRFDRREAAVLDRHGLLELCRTLGNGALHFRGIGSPLLEDGLIRGGRGRQERPELACRSALSQSLTAELERIRQGGRQAPASGQPVHYVLESASPSYAARTRDVLLEALWDNGRLRHRRWVQLGINEDTCLRGGMAHGLYRGCVGGTVVVNLRRQSGDQGPFASAELHALAQICETALEFRREVLTLFILPAGSEAARQTLEEELGTTPLVTIKEEVVFGAAARKYLRASARALGLKPDRRLVRAVKDDQTGLLGSDLDNTLGEWFQDRLVDTVYPQYREFARSSGAASRQARGAALKELNAMIGLTEAKTVVAQALDFYQAQHLLRTAGLKAEALSGHMVFTGHPGTAKTAVARLFAQIAKDNGLLSKGNLVECGRADLVGRFVGWTAPTVIGKFREAQGSVLFIDEAYSLVDEKAGLFGDEAINTIVQEMENRRGELIVILAGYPDKMDEFLARNPGLRSRVAFHVRFPDYNVEELLDITELIARQKGRELAGGVRDKLRPIFAAAIRTPDFGNGRYARNLVERAERRQAGRLVRLAPGELTPKRALTLTPEDFESFETDRARRFPVGFQAA
jgi:hypothetical protein